jgi:hypothetical protein
MIVVVLRSILRGTCDTMLRHDSETIAHIWSQFHGIARFLDEEDDEMLWQEAIGQIIADARQFASDDSDKKAVVIAHVGRCSHWLRPHQSRWVTNADGGFAAPIGYVGSGFSPRRLPEFDWSLKWQWDRDSVRWIQSKQPNGKRLFEFRIAIPSRTRRHAQAAVHTLWRPGTPANPNNKLVQFYGFRKDPDTWELTAHWSNVETT